MKIIKLFSFLLVLSLVALTFGACKENNDEPDDIPSYSDLIGSVWKGVNQNSGYTVEVSIYSENNCRVSYSYQDYTYDEMCTCAYNETNGEFLCIFEGYQYEGYIKGNMMKLTVAEYGTFSLKRVK